MEEENSEKRPNRSGTKWSEDQYLEAGWVRRSLRLRADEAAALDTVAKAWKMPIARVVGALALAETARRKRERDRAKRP